MFYEYSYLPYNSKDTVICEDLKLYLGLHSWWYEDLKLSLGLYGMSTHKTYPDIALQ